MMQHERQSNVIAASACADLSAAIQQADLVCGAAIEGRLAGRALVAWSRPLAVGEADFQVLWYLRFAVAPMDQATIAARLALSAAQVSNSVERLGAKGWIAGEVARGDRRRRMWRITLSGAEQLEGLLREFGPPSYWPTVSRVSVSAADAGLERHLTPGARPVLKEAA